MASNDVIDTIVVGSQDLLKVRCVDAYVDQQTGQFVEAARDLSSDTVQLMYATDGGTGIYGAYTTTAMTPDPDQSSNKGYAQRRWGVADLTAGAVKMRIKITDNQTFVHLSDAIFAKAEAQ